MIFLPNRDITESVDIFSNVLCNIFNSFIVSYSSKCLAEISPFYRKGNKRVKLENSISPNLSKNYGKTMPAQMIKLAFPKYQCGFGIWFST